MLKEQAAKLIVRIAEKAAENAVCKASPWDKFQPEESARVREWAEENRRNKKTVCCYFSRSMYGSCAGRCWHV